MTSNNSDAIATAGKPSSNSDPATVGISARALTQTTAGTPAVAAKPAAITARERN